MSSFSKFFLFLINRKYFQFNFEANEGIDEKSLLDLLPISLRDEVIFELYEAKVKCIDLFRGLSNDCIKALVGRLNQQVRSFLNLNLN